MDLYGTGGGHCWFVVPGLGIRESAARVLGLFQDFRRIHHFKSRTRGTRRHGRSDAGLRHPGIAGASYCAGQGHSNENAGAGIREGGKAQRSLLAAAHRQAYASMALAMHVAACNKEHALEPRLARWLLMSRDCLATSTFEITQEFLGQMLGARRPSVNIAASALQRRGLVSYSRGIVKLLDVPGLQVASCSCYAVIRRLTRE